jgi:pimeloyl-ACP methyl ester carboxylesterase
MRAQPGKARTATLLAFASVLVATGCSTARTGAVPSSAAPVRPVSSSPPASIAPPAAPPSGAVGKLCGYPDAPGRLTKVAATDGVWLDAIRIGSGPRGVVLVPELGNEGNCGWWPYAAYLAARGFNVVAIDHRCTGGSDCPAGPAGDPGSAAKAPAGLMADINGAVRSLRASGAVKVALAGGSQGGAEVLLAATRPPPGMTGVVALSADELSLPLATSPYPATVQAAAPRVRLPVLMAVSSNDSLISVQDTRRLYASVGSHGKRLVILGPQAGHGWNLVDPNGPGLPLPAFAATVTAFLQLITGGTAPASGTARSARPTSPAS